MTKQEFAIRLLFWLMPWPLSKALPRILRRILAGPTGQTPLQWAQATYDALTQFLSDAAAYAETLFDIIPDIPPTDQLTEAQAALTTAIENVGLATDPLTPIMADLDAYTPDQISDVFSDAIDAMLDLVSAMDDLQNAIEQIAPQQLPDVAPPPEPPYLSPFPPLYPGGSGLGLWGPTYSSQPAKPVTPPWFYDDFDAIDPAVWTDYSSGTGTNSIVNNKLKMLSSQAGDYAYLTTTTDDTIPQSFTWTFELKIESGTGQMFFVLYTGVVAFWVIFDPPNILKFRHNDIAGYKSIDVGDYMAVTYTWKFIYDGTLCDIYRDDTLIDSGLTVYTFTGQKGKRLLSCDDILTVFIDDYTITPL